MSNSVADKIRKLIAVADGSSHPEEADAFMAKAHALMQAHGLSLLDLGRLGEDAVGLDKDAMQHSAAYGFMTKVASAMAKYYGCKIVLTREGRNESYSVAGRESARITFVLMVPFVHRQIMELGRVGFNAGKYANRMQAVTRIGNAVALRIWQMVRGQEAAAAKAKAEAEATGASTARYATTGVNALVPVDLLETAIAEAFPDLRKAKITSLKTDSYSKEAANKVNLNSQAGYTPKAQIGSR